MYYEISNFNNAYRKPSGFLGDSQVSGKEGRPKEADADDGNDERFNHDEHDDGEYS
jgi:hypothetical protein